MKDALSELPLIDHIFPEPLINAGFSGKNSTKATFEGNPEIIVRWNPGDEDITEAEVAISLQEYSILRGDYGIAVPPLSIVRGQRLYVMTRRVHGEDVEDTLRSRPSAQVLTKYEELLASQARYMRDRATPGAAYLSDILGPAQYVHGVLLGEPEPALYLVDTELCHRVFDPGRRLYEWVRRVGNITQYVSEAEIASRRKFPKPREVLSECLDVLSGYNTDPIAQKYLEQTIRGKRIFNDDRWEGIINDWYIPRKF